MRHIGLFEGIGGFSLAARWMNWETVAWCEVNEFCQKVLKHHFPNAEGHGDIKTTDFSIYNGRCDIVTGGFPCQPFSTAGKRKGTADDRHLWPEMFRAIREVQPRWVVGENVPGIINWSKGLVFEQIQADLEAEGFEVFPPCILPACGIGAPHRRNRLWIVAHNNKRNGEEVGLQARRKINVHSITRTQTIANTEGIRERSRTKKQGEDDKCREQLEGTESGSNNNNNGESWFATNSKEQRFPKRDAKQAWDEAYSTTERHGGISRWQDFPTQSPVCSRDDGLFTGLAGITFSKHRTESIKAYGNSIVPQIAYELFKIIEQINKNGKLGTKF